MDKSANTLHTFDSCAAEYAEKFMDVSAYGSHLDRFCAELPRHASVLDIGCGPGNITKYLLRKNPSWQVKGIDLSPKMIQIARRQNPVARFEVMDCRSIGALDEKFDGILCSFCTPYLSDIETTALIADASSLLHARGMLYLSTMEGDYASSGMQKSSSGEFETYIHYHSARFLTDAFAAAGLDILTESRQPYPVTGKATATDLFMLGMKR